MSNGFTARVTWVTRIAILGLFFSLFFSRSLFVLCGLVALVGCLLSGRYAERARGLVLNPAAVMILAFVAYIFVSAAVAFAGTDTVTALKVYWQLLLIPVIASTMTREGDIERCWNAYAIGAALLLTHIVLLPWYQPGWVASADPSRVFFNPLPQSVSLAIFAGWCAFCFMAPAQLPIRRFFLAVGFVLASWAVLYVSQQRLGFVAWAIMVGAGVVLRVPQYWRWRAVVLVTIAVSSILLANDTFRERMLLGIIEFQAYNHQADFSSIGARRYFWATTWTAIQEAPWIGHGTGSYREVIGRAFNNPDLCQIGCMHPHQQYLMYWLELGVFGLVIFLGALVSMAIYHFRHACFHPLALPVLMVFCVSGFVDTPLWYRGFLYLFVPLLGLLMIQQPKKSDVLLFSGSDNLTERT